MSSVAGSDAQALNDSIADRVEALVAAAPPFSAGQRARLAAILGSVAPARPAARDESRPGQHQD